MHGGNNLKIQFFSKNYNLFENLFSQINHNWQITFDNNQSNIEKQYFFNDLIVIGGEEFNLNFKQANKIMLGNFSRYDSKTFSMPVNLKDLIKYIEDFELSQYNKYFDLENNCRVYFNLKKVEFFENKVIEEVNLTDKEAKLLKYLYETTKSRSKEEILSEIWGYDDSIETKTFETHLHKLKKKLPFLDDLIINSHGLYKLKKK